MELLACIFFLFYHFQPAFLKTATQTFEVGNFLQVFIRFWGFWYWFSYKNILMKKNVYFFNQTVCKQGSRTQFQLSWKVESVKNWKKELYITHCRGSAPTPGACTLGVCIKHADDPEKNSIFIHRLLFCSKPAQSYCATSVQVSTKRNK